MIQNSYQGILIQRSWNSRTESWPEITFVTVHLLINHIHYNTKRSEPSGAKATL